MPPTTKIAPSKIHYANAAAKTVELDLSIVIPIYNSASTLGDLMNRLSKVIVSITQSYEIILVDDGSSDDSWAVIQTLLTTYADNLVAVQFMRNFGQHHALMCGLSRARGEYVVTMDDDLQNPPEDIPKLLAHIKQNDLDLVYGYPSKRDHANWLNIGSTLVMHFYRTVFRNPVNPTPFRIMLHQLAQSVMFYDLNSTFLDSLVARCTSRIGGVELAHHPRAQGAMIVVLAVMLFLAQNYWFFPHLSRNEAA